MKKIIILSAIAALSLSAANFQTVGYKSISMGGASVSNSTSNMAIYSNPALLALNKNSHEKTSFSIGEGGTIIDSGAASFINDINKLNFGDTFDKLIDNVESSNLESLDLIKKSRDLMLKNEKSSLNIKYHAHLLLNINNFGFGFLNTTDSKGTLNIDTSKTKLIVWSDTNNNGINDESDLYTNIENATYDTNGNISSLGNSSLEAYNNESLFKDISDKKHTFEIQAINIMEVPIGYGHMFHPDKNSQLMLGVSGKLLIGQTYIKSFNVDFDNNFSYGMLDNVIRSTTYGIDVGVAYRNNLLRNVTFGAVAKNINTPSFKVFDSTDYILKPSVKAGVSYVGTGYEIAIDSDLTENQTFNGLEQIIGGGISFTPWEKNSSWNATSFRAGIKTNLANENKDLIYSAGVSLGVKELSLDIAGEYGGNNITIGDYNLKENMGLAVNIVSKF